MAKIAASDVRKGLLLAVGDRMCRVVSWNIWKSDRRSRIQMKLKELLTGRTSEVTAQPDDRYDVLDPCTSTAWGGSLARGEQIEMEVRVAPLPDGVDEVVLTAGGWLPSGPVPVGDGARPWYLTVPHLADEAEGRTYVAAEGTADGLETTTEIQPLRLVRRRLGRGLRRFAQLAQAGVKVVERGWSLLIRHPLPALHAGGLPSSRRLGRGEPRKQSAKVSRRPQFLRHHAVARSSSASSSATDTSREMPRSAMVTP